MLFLRNGDSMKKVRGLLGLVVITAVAFILYCAAGAVAQTLHGFVKPSAVQHCKNKNLTLSFDSIGPAFGCSSDNWGSVFKG